MKGDFTVTVWHFDDNSEVPERRIFNDVYFDGTNRISKNGIKQKGFYNGTGCGVRIPTSDESFVLPGDYLEVGKSSCDYPDRDKCLKVIEVKDNRRGGMPHWRITCGG